MRTISIIGSLTLTVGSFAAHAQTPDVPAQEDEIIVQRQRLSAVGLSDTTLILERHRAARITIEMDGNGRFRSFLGGRFHDQGRWRIEGQMVCFDAKRPGESSCAEGILDKRPGDEWDTLLPGGKLYKAKLVAGAVGSRWGS